jgi:hypothetical protein
MTMKDQPHQVASGRSSQCSTRIFRDLAAGSAGTRALPRLANYWCKSCLHGKARLRLDALTDPAGTHHVENEENDSSEESTDLEPWVLNILPSEIDPFRRFAS